MANKVINFNHAGGVYVQEVNMVGNCIPWGFECDADWIKITKGTRTLTITSLQTFDFHDRTASIKIFDRNRKEITIDVIQTGYYNLYIDCMNSVVLYQNYYDTNEYFNVYITVYGGKQQSIICEELKEYIMQVWDNSDLYNDYVLRIPKTLSGVFHIKHSECDEYIEYCKKYNIPYSDKALEFDLSISQITQEDIIGKMVLAHDDIICDNKSTLYINSSDVLKLKIISTSYVNVISNSEYEIIDGKNVIFSNVAPWVDVCQDGDIIKIKAKQYNSLNDRETMLRIVNNGNSRQFIDVLLVQKEQS